MDWTDVRDTDLLFGLSKRRRLHRPQHVQLYDRLVRHNLWYADLRGGLRERRDVHSPGHM